MKGLILINAFPIKEILSQSERLREEFEKRGVQADVRRNDFFAVTVEKELFCNVEGYDFCVFLDKDKYVLQGLERAGIPLFNSYAAIEACDDKMTTALLLAGYGIDMPRTLPAVFCYDREAEIPHEAIDKIEGSLGYPLIVKECYGSRGTGVRLVRDRAELIKISDELKCTPHLYQKFISKSCGKDVRVIVIGKKVFGAILRESKSDFRSNVALGGSVSEYALPPKAKEMCERAAAILNLDYCGIDLLFGKNGEFLLCEVNSNAFFSGFERATKKNAAGAYADHILSELTRRAE